MFPRLTDQTEMFERLREMQEIWQGQAFSQRPHRAHTTPHHLHHKTSLRLSVMNHGSVIWRDEI